MKNFLLIGASSGIGHAIADTLSRQGHNVMATFNTSKPDGNFDNVSFHQLNVLDKDFDLSYVPDTLDGLVYCPGSINLKPFSRIKTDDFAADYELQVLGAIKTIQKVLPKLKASGKASILMFSTVAVQHGFNFHSQVSASKGAVEGLTKALAAEFAPTIRVNAIAPSITHTKLAERLLNTDEKIEANANRHAMKRIGKPEDIASMASFLLSEEASWITGQILNVDGGMSTIK